MASFHLLPVADATIAAFVADGMGSGPLFGKAWQAEQGMTMTVALGAAIGLAFPVFVVIGAVLLGCGPITSTPEV